MEEVCQQESQSKQFSQKFKSYELPQDPKRSPPNTSQYMINLTKMKPFWSANLLAAATGILLIIICLNLQVSQAKGLHQNRHNLVDPVFAYDDVDAHYVSVSNSPLSSAPVRASSSSSLSPARSSVDYQDASELRTLLSQVADSRDDDLARAVSLRSLEQTATSPVAKTTPLLVPSSTRTGQPDSYQPQASNQQVSVDRSKSLDEQQQQPHHWSGLENYYHKMRQAQRHPIQLQTAYQVPNSDLYQIVQQQEVDNLPVGGYSQLAGYLPGNVALANRHPVAKLNPAFLLPLIGGRNNDQQQVLQQQQITIPDNNGLDYTVYHNSAPGVSQTGGIGAGSILLRPQATDSSSLAGSPQVAGSVAGNGRDDGRFKYLDWGKLPELLLIQQQQQRLRHQQETFGSWYDQKHYREMLQEEAFCGPRNYVSALTPGGIKELDNKNAQVQLSRLQAQLSAGSPVRLDDVPAISGQQPASPGEYPSHVGLYNGSSTSDENYLCAAAWIHESYALTLASCVRFMEPTRIMFRLGEWNLNRPMNQSLRSERPMVTGQVDRIHVFPNDSMEHNLALVHFSKPVEFIELPYICPACQIQTHSSVRASSCWTPSRNVSLVEYFDADGEGETKEKKSIGMVDLPVKLMANDDAECQRQTKAVHFHLNHPNYICAGDYRKSAWRARLNNSDTFGSGIYCIEDGNLSLVSIVHPVYPNSLSAYGYMDLSYYRPWIRNVISGRSY